MYNTMRIQKFWAAYNGASFHMTRPNIDDMTLNLPFVAAKIYW